MEWTKAITEAVGYMESHMLEDITLQDVAGHVNISPFYFHKGFLMLCGYSVAEYIRNRRLALAGEELITSDITVLELALKYGYDSPDSFTKAFSRFHGYTPSIVRKNRLMVKAFAPLKLTISLKGGQNNPGSHMGGFPVPRRTPRCPGRHQHKNLFRVAPGAAGL